MQTFFFGENPRPLSRVALGTWAMGGADWGKSDDAHSIRTIHTALDLGIDLFDTAPVYGLGHAEEVLGRALKGKRDRAFVATKVGIRWTEVRYYQDLSAASVKKECDESLKRLGTEWIDLLQIHWPHGETPLSETMGALNDLKAEGKIRHIGVSNFDVKLMREARSHGIVDFLQPPFHLFFRGAEEEILPFCKEAGIATLIYGPLCKGLLTGKFLDKPVPEDIRQKDPFFDPKVLPRLLEITARLEAFADKEGITLAQLALAWTLARPGISCVIVGARSPEQIRETAEAGEINLSIETLQGVESCIQEAPHVV
ncbi:MAG: aldo/keto reductase [Planctomycetota bacterium]|jgi:aryl-alcohol dehydrogenase-like predicted oxidoreductase